MIRILIVSFTIFWAILWTGEAIRCQQCKEIGEEYCSGPFVECENEDAVCTTAKEYSSINGETEVTAFRGCLDSYMKCNQLLTMNADVFNMTFYYDCCDSDDCNNGTIVVPPLNTTENGVICPHCFKVGSYQCEEYDYIACTGNQRACMEFGGDATRAGHEEGKYAFACCASGDVCQIGYDILIGCSVGDFKNMNCTVH
ncbi:phospholipase A2 inhibitor and Ly6/PLAUR domain-containing protein-like [Ranitomeya variabilis]|uniref:phospholipase A2 inhibitor and Ly6/PLAUR domain-containing protein-like n=1 Tax=Ranitomeya variabilis TaxID=490064 RepID=UPI00405681CF